MRFIGGRIHLAIYIQHTLPIKERVVLVWLKTHFKGDCVHI
jgi:hypothetical protein